MRHFKHFYEHALLDVMAITHMKYYEINTDRQVESILVQYYCRCDSRWTIELMHKKIWKEFESKD